MKRLLTTAAALLLCFGVVAPQAAQAQTQVNLGPRIGVPFGDLSDGGANLFFGADARIHSEALPVVANPSFDYYLTDTDGVSYFTVDLNALYEFGVDNQAFTPYAGGGLGITRASFDVPSFGGIGGGSTSTTDVGLNIVGGARFMLDPVDPFVQLNASFGGDFTRLGIAGGILFSL